VKILGGGWRRGNFKRILWSRARDDLKKTNHFPMSELGNCGGLSGSVNLSGKHQRSTAGSRLAYYQAEKSSVSLPHMYLLALLDLT
jgi:hypothetical protein